MTSALSAIVFSRNQTANLLPALKGNLLFSCRANNYIWTYESRVGGSTSYSTVLWSMKKFREQSIAAVKELAKAPTSGVMFRFDNVQKYCKPRFTRLGRDSHMMIGTAATAFALEGFTIDALDLDERRKWINKDLRGELTFDKFYDSIDRPYLDTAMELHWLKILVESVPELSHYIDQVHTLINTTGSKKKLTPRHTRTFTSPTNGYSETALAELGKSIRAILTNLGQTKETYIRRLWLAGGDGLSFERLIQLLNYLQFEDDEFNRMEFLMPLLESWHALWTDLSRIYEAHWDSLTSRDPSSIGYGAKVIDRGAPANLKKVEYYKFEDLANIELTARVLDCWR